MRVSPTRALLVAKLDADRSDASSSLRAGKLLKRDLRAPFWADHDRQIAWFTSCRSRGVIGVITRRNRSVRA